MRPPSELASRRPTPNHLTLGEVEAQADGSSLLLNITKSLLNRPDSPSNDNLIEEEEREVQ